MKHSLLVLLLSLVCLLPTMAQDDTGPTFAPMVRVGKVRLAPDGTINGTTGDSIKYVELNSIYVNAPVAFKNDRQQKAYTRLVRNVKIVLPIAKEVNRAILETYEYLQTLPNQKAREEHMKLVEKSVKAEYTPRMKKLSLSQGKLLIKLIYRETNSSSYQLVQAFLGSTRAAFYQAFAWMFGASLKKEYDPKGKDRLTERVVRLVESGQL